MKLLVSWMSELSTYISREFYFVMRDLIEVHGWHHIEPPLLAMEPGEARRTLLRRVGEIPETILFWEAFDLCAAMQPALRDMECRACLFADDLHQLWGSESLRDLKLRGFRACDTILSPYAYVFDDFYQELRGECHLVWVPHAASPDFAVPFNENPENAILLSGAVGEHYPLRGRMKDLQEEGRFAIALREHPGYDRAYDYSNDASVGTSYARTLGRYRAAITDASIFHYVVAKHFEIPATGCLLVTDRSVRPQMTELGFIEGVHYLTAGIDDLEERLRYVLSHENKGETDSIRQRGRELVSSRHTTAIRARQIDQVCSGHRN